MGVRVPSDPRMLRILDRPGYRNAVRRHGQTQVSSCYDLPRVDCDGYGFIPMAILGFLVGILADWQPFHW